MNIGVLLVEKNAINDAPKYQREGGIWSIEKQQLFLDSLFNDYDVPKLYFHDLRDADPRYKYSVIDGKQRLHAVWSFLDGRIPLADDFELITPVQGHASPKPKAKYGELPTYWQETFRSKSLDVVLVQNAAEDDIEDLFSRLNNGEPLNAAEKRNAMGGAMCEVIRKVSGLSFFKRKLGFKDSRYAHREVAAKLILIEKHADGGDPFCDLKKKFLDKMVAEGRGLNEAQCTLIHEKVVAGLKPMSRVFSLNDPLLSKQAYPPMYYLFLKSVTLAYAHTDLYQKLKRFLPHFQTLRLENNAKDEDQRDPTLTEFGRLIQQGTNDLDSLKNRVSILTKYFLIDNPDVKLRDSNRTFTQDERYVLWLRGDKKCAKCGAELATLDAVQGDHRTQWAHGGETVLKNGRALCESCNLEAARRVR